MSGGTVQPVQVGSGVTRNPRPANDCADPRIVHILTREEYVDYDRSSLYAADHDRIQQLVRLNRKEMWQVRVKWFCVAVAVFAAVYFAAQFLRIAL